MHTAVDVKQNEESPVADAGPRISLRLYPDLERAILAWMRRHHRARSPRGRLERDSSAGPGCEAAVGESPRSLPPASWSFSSFSGTPSARIGVRRRQLQDLLQSEGYDPLAASGMS